jgi:hypothetical protein
MVVFEPMPQPIFELTFEQDPPLQEATTIYMNYELNPEEMHNVNYHQERAYDLSSHVIRLTGLLGITVETSPMPDEIYRIMRLQSFHYYALSILSQTNRTEIQDLIEFRYMCNMGIRMLTSGRTTEVINLNILNQFRTMFQTILDSL